MAKHHHHHHYHRQTGSTERATSPNPHRFYRDPDSLIGGVCGGIATYFGWNRAFVRLAALISLFIFPPLALFSYLVAWWLIKKRPPAPIYNTPEEERFWRNVSTSPKMTMSELRHRFRKLEGRLVAMEQIVTSEEYDLGRAFRDLDREK